ncbi:MAG: NfeD family protein [Pseudomonadota bacterium]
MSLADVQYWHWLILGVLLLVAELAAAGSSFMMWIGFAALATGVLAFLLPIGWPVELVLFAVFSVLSVWLWKKYVKEAPAPDAPILNRRGAEHVGKVVRLEEAIVGGSGRIRIDDTLWTVRGDDAPAGSKVRIRAQDGNLFDVDPVDPS